MKKKVFSYFHPVKWIFFCFGKVSKNQFDSVFFSCREAFPSILWKLLMLIFEKTKKKLFGKIQNIIGSILFENFPFSIFFDDQYRYWLYFFWILQRRQFSFQRYFFATFFLFALNPDDDDDDFREKNDN